MISQADLAFAYRKAPIVPPQHAAAQQYNNANVQAQQRAEAERREKMRRTARNPTDKNIPEGVEDICIGDGVVRYRELREVERTLDATMMRKKLDVMDSKHHSRASRYGTMRVWISNTVENQPWQSTGIDADAFDFESNTNPTYRVKIQGRLLDDEGDEGLEDDEEDQDADAMDEDSKDAKPVAKPKPFSSYFASITIDFDRAKSLQPDNFTQIEWKRSSEPATAKDVTFSELEFERKGDENINITVNLQRYQNPEVRAANLVESMIATANLCTGLPSQQTSCRAPRHRRGRPRGRVDGHLGIRKGAAPATRRRRAQVRMRRKA
jgi:SWI/SNF-related matrix-associated actin-dependent regulator of chromatin subfamily D